MDGKINETSKDSLISESFFHPPKNVPNHYPEHCIFCHLEHFLLDGIKRENFLRLSQLCDKQVGLVYG